MKHLRLSGFLTVPQIARAKELYDENEKTATERIHDEVVRPNIETINQKLGGANNTRYVAYAITYVCQQMKKGAGRYSEQPAQNAQ
jgi:hypothetical protein